MALQNKNILQVEHSPRVCDDKSMNEMKEQLSQPPRQIIFVVFLLIAILLHLLLLQIPIDWISSTRKPPPIEIQEVNPKKLEQIRKQWKEKGLLLDQNPDQSKKDKAPPNARYLSDRNIHVEKEQRARSGNVVPKKAQPQKPSKAPNKAKDTVKRRLNLGDLGVPMRIGELAPKTQDKPVQEGGNQFVLDKDVPEGSETILNAQESVFYSFYARLYETIGPIWQSHLRSTATRDRIVPGDYTTVVEVILDDQGNLRSVNRVRSSGVSEFDQVVDEAWHKIQRFPNPPKGLLEADGNVHTGWSFTVHVTEGYQFQLLPPERSY